MKIVVDMLENILNSCQVLCLGSLGWPKLFSTNSSKNLNFLLGMSAMDNSENWVLMKIPQGFCEFIMSGKENILRLLKKNLNS